MIKRHNFSRQKKTHGTGHTERAPGSIGQASDPSRVFPGMSDLKSLYEQEKTNYLQEENNIEQISEDMKRLIEGLETRGKNETETQ